ncbi:phosphate/phosphite/phosphonate ABC transporter substrate-binding protein [Palleronia sp. LCG004]|uniref:phosphate/phosphite/phosphonate ABC transporter substrate-binding protein n=1 Tax=Palleronia sp. LCG004 TaxID=3079304 RepID=UPI002943554D|nr:phosphate/phosphite/phosphonate ABC transporter substrate-binding protein [Palleronia sp. LCG004]WOI56303.1 phosphate/phosphite/phosphonate ABC transporter substrate-binding protein [Palleronia sp. LCG004]
MISKYSALIGVVALGLGVPAHAQFQLSDRYSDEDGDLMADVPSDESDLIDPSTLIFSYTPVEDPAVYEGVWEGFLDHLSEVTGKDVQFFPVQNNAAQIEAMRAGRLHVAGVNTGGTPLAVACAGFRPFAMMAANDGSFGYEMEIITYPDSGIESVEDIAGKTMTFTSETSNSGNKAPSAILETEFGLTAGEDFDVSYSGAHDSSVLGVVNQDYEAAAVANSVLNRMLERDVVSRDQIETIYTSETFPTTAYGTVYNLTPELQDSIREAFMSFDWEGTALAQEFLQSGEEQFIEISFKDDWAVIRTIDEANGVTYECN